MQIQSTDNLQFGAGLVRRVNLNGKKVNFVKFNTGSKNDVKALAEIKTLWGGKNLSAGIAEEAEILGKDAQIYGLTLQSNNFRNVDSSKVLGLISTDKITKGKETEVFKIGTNPKYAYEQKRSKRSIKHIASTMLENIKNLNGNSKLVVNNAEPQEMKFLNKVGIEPETKRF